LIQSVPTRSNSTYYMLERFIELSDNISLALLECPKAPMLTASKLQLATEIIQVMNPIEAATKEICGEQYVTGSKIIPLI
ncbi:Zinc finger BED domain-containing protein 4, partial [Camponotus floridanus]